MCPMHQRQDNGEWQDFYSNKIMPWSDMSIFMWFGEILFMSTKKVGDVSSMGEQMGKDFYIKCLGLFLWLDAEYHFLQVEKGEIKMKGVRTFLLLSTKINIAQLSMNVSKKKYLTQNNGDNKNIYK